MASLVYSMMDLVFGNSLVTTISNDISEILTALNAALNGSGIIALYSIFIGISMSLATIYFFMDITSQISRETFTIDKMIVELIKYFIAFCVILYLKELLLEIFKLADSIYKVISSSTTISESTKIDGITFFGKSTWSEVGRTEFIEGFKAETKGLDGISTSLSVVVALILPYIVSQICRLAAYLVVMSNALLLLVRAIFAPIAVANLFEEGQRSSGIRYIKGFAATALIFAGIMGVLYASSLLQLGAIDTEKIKLAIDGASDITFENFDNIVKASDVTIMFTCVQAGTIGALLGISKVMHDVIGA